MSPSLSLTRTTTIRIIKVTSLVLIVLIIVAYGISRSLNYARGPKINLNNPIDGSTATSSVIELIGRVERANNLTINGHPTTIDEQGDFKTNILLFSGINVITIRAEDQFGRNTEITRTLVW